MIDDYSQAEQELRKALQKQRRLAWGDWQRRKEKERQLRLQTVTPLERPRREYVDVDTAADLAWCKPAVIKRACDDGELPCRRPNPPHRLILKTDLREWMERTGRD